ncbi:MAG: VOC family protein [Nitriliruptorales bacterium]
MEHGHVNWPIWVGVVVDDLEGQRRFYRDTLGFAELSAGEDSVWFDGGWPHLFELIPRPADPYQGGGGYRVGFAVEDIRAARVALIARGAEPLGDVEGSESAGGWWCAFRDPEGNVFEIKEAAPPPAV